MKHNKTNPIHWIADEGKTIVRKADNYDMGEELWLGLTDNIDNYEEQKI